MNARSIQANDDRIRLEGHRRTIYEIAEAIAPGWERWRARNEETTAPVREWMITELTPRPGDTVLELAAGAGDTGFEAAAIVGERGQLSGAFGSRCCWRPTRNSARLGVALPICCRSSSHDLRHVEWCQLAGRGISGG